MGICRFAEALSVEQGSDFGRRSGAVGDLLLLSRVHGIDGFESVMTNRLVVENYSVVIHFLPLGHIAFRVD